MPTPKTTKTLSPTEATPAATTAAPAQPAEPAPLTLALVRKDREQFDLLIATLEKLGKCVLAAAIVGPHKTGEGVKREVERFWEAF